MIHSQQLREAVAAYNQDLGSGAFRAADDLVRKDGWVIKGGRPHCDVLRPLFLDVAQYERIREAATHVSQAISRLGTVLLAQPELRNRLRLSPEQVRLLENDARDPSSTGWACRLDGFLDRDGEIRFVEYNAGSPGGMIDNDVIADIFGRFEPMRRLGERFRLQSLPLKTHIVGCLVSAVPSVRHGISRLALIPPAEPDGMMECETDPEIVGLLGLFIESGLEAHLTPVESLELGSGALRSKGQPIDAVVVLDWPSLVTAVHSDHAFWQAVRRRHVWLVNSLASALLCGTKSFFELLSDPNLSSLFDADTRVALARHIPWTRTLIERKTEYRDRTVDLLPFIETHRDNLVLKPAFASGGEGVVLGWECDQASWKVALERALGARYVVQERVEVPSEEFPCVVEGELRFDSRSFDCNPYVWPGGHVEGMLVRLSRSGILNLSAGATCATPFLLG